MIDELRVDRTSSQKPGDELYENFRQHFPSISSTATTSAIHVTGSTSLVDVAAHAAIGSERPRVLAHEDIKDQDPTPRAQHEPWRFTPSLLDPSAFTFTNFGNQPGFYTPTPGGTNPLYHNQAGDLHTPGMGIGIGLGTPFSMPTSDLSAHPGAFSSYGHAMQAHPFQNYNPFGQHHPQPHQASYAPSTFIHQDTGYETMEHDGSPMDDEAHMGPLDGKSDQQSPLMSYHPQPYETRLAHLPPMAEKFRFHVTLNAPTAMTKHPKEIPVTYLNKGQAYSIVIVDTTPTVPIPPGVRYRTFLRISFEDEQQRQRPATCWQLWKEGRGTNEAHQRGGRLQAVEHVEAGQPPASDDKRTRVELDTASFDGFSVIWTPGLNGLAECSVAVRFNFLSTDFSHSKGVKGIPVRLCAKTQALPLGSPPTATEATEVAYCKVKLFRDHGAERKLSNDVAHVKKTIDKLKQQIAQADTGMKDISKRKRSGSTATKAQPSQRPGKVQKHKRTWSMSSASSAGGRVPVEDDTHAKLQAMQDMFTSTRPVSILYLRGTEEDDPDLCPVALLGEPLDLTKVDSRESIRWQQRDSGQSSSTTGTSSLVSPSPSSTSLQSQRLGSTSLVAPPTQWNTYQVAGSTDIQGSNPQQLASPPDQLTKIPKPDVSGSLSGWIEALGVDSSYRPPAERLIKPVACFYILKRDPTHIENHEYYRAIYLRKRTLKEFISSVALKWNLEPTSIRRALHVLPKGLQVEMDDDVIRELFEGQDMILEISLAGSAPLKREWDMAVDPPIDSDADATKADMHVDSYELKLFF